MAELIINNKDAFKEWSVRMGDNFLDVLGAPVPMKEFIENKSRLEHGKQVITDNPKLDEREFTLVFTIVGSSQADFQTKKKAFYEELYKGAINIQVPANGSDIYHLIYLGKSISFAQSFDRTFCKISAKFCEPNPSLRT
ncbi:hypothetical protein AAE250_20845 [Bacteroides sp. GD17]|jgi:hypothetical protein|uniref:hypothetical protein n=1 Tax=Bacteroides sp. GD17 TaxID=3139826 RepID=UPI00205CAFEB|nr:hypothetical protein [uncultured Bacteroides sp.]DAV89749.1 MAG TPA: tail protein [Caudoviricetes sp.]